MELGITLVGAMTAADLDWLEKRFENEYFVQPLRPQ